MLRVRGYASTERIDRDGDVIRSDAFAESLQDYLRAGGVVLYNHDKNVVIGKCEKVSIDEKGLLVEALIFTKNEDILTAIKEGALKSFSVGFLAKEYSPTEQGVVFERGDLLEISVVSVPANPDATFTIVEEIIDEAKDVDDYEEQSPKSDGVAAESGDMYFVVKDVSLLQKNNENRKEESMETIKDVITNEVEEATKSIAEEEVTKEQKIVEKAVNTLAASTQFATTARAFVFDGLADGKMFYVPNVQMQMETSTVQVPILGEATVATGEGGVSSDSNVGTNTITLTASQYTARYPLSYLLEAAGGNELVQSLEANLKKSIARKFDATAWAALKGTPTTFDFDTKTAKDLLEAIMLADPERFSEPANCALVVDPKAYAWLLKQDAVLTVDKFGPSATIATGSLGKVFGMDVYVVPVSETYETVIAVNKDYVASGQFGDIAYVRMVDSSGTTYIIAKALLAFGKAASGGVISFTDNA